MRPSSSLWIGIAILSAALLACSAASVPSTSSPAVSQPTAPSPAKSAPTASPEAATAAPSSSSAVACPGSLETLAAILALSRDQRLSYFGGSTINFRAVVVPGSVDCIPVTVKPAWLWCPPAALLAAPPTAATDPGLGSGLAVDPSTPRGGGFVFASSADVAMLEAYLAPAAASARAQLVPGPTMLVTGHFDDPAALTCRVVSVGAGSPSPSPSDVVQGCRASFVITGVTAGSSG